jgi:hypothetical protein
MQLTDDQRCTGSHLPRGFRERVRRHEEHHQRCARAFGADLKWGYEDPRSGAAAEFTVIRYGHLEPVQMAAIFYAGGSGCCASYDEKVTRRWINRYPRGERRTREAEARELAQRYR